MYDIRKLFSIISGFSSPLQKQSVFIYKICDIRTEYMVRLQFSSKLWEHTFLNFVIFAWMNYIRRVRQVNKQCLMTSLAISFCPKSSRPIKFYCQYFDTLLLECALYRSMCEKQKFDAGRNVVRSSSIDCCIRQSS